MTPSPGMVGPRLETKLVQRALQQQRLLKWYIAFGSPAYFPRLPDRSHLSLFSQVDLRETAGPQRIRSQVLRCLRSNLAPGERTYDISSCDRAMMPELNT